MRKLSGVGCSLYAANVLTRCIVVVAGQLFQTGCRPVATTEHSELADRVEPGRAQARVQYLVQTCTDHTLMRSISMLAADMRMP